MFIFYLVLDRYHRRLQSVDFLTRNGIEIPSSERSHHLNQHACNSTNSHDPLSIDPRQAYNPPRHRHVQYNLSRRETIDLYPTTRYEYISSHSYRPEPRNPRSPPSAHSDGYRLQQDSWREPRPLQQQQQFPERETQRDRTATCKHSSSSTRHSHESRSRSRSHSGERRDCSFHSPTNKTQGRPVKRFLIKDDGTYDASGTGRPVVHHKSPSTWAWSNPEPPSNANVERLKSLVQVSLRRKQSPQLFPRSRVPEQQQASQHVHSRIGKYLVDRQRARTPVRAAALHARAPAATAQSLSAASASDLKPPSVRSLVLPVPASTFASKSNLANSCRQRVESVVGCPRRAPSLLRVSAMRAVARARSILNRRDSAAPRSNACYVSR